MMPGKLKVDETSSVNRKRQFIFRTFTSSGGKGKVTQFVEDDALLEERSGDVLTIAKEVVKDGEKPADSSKSS